jgi:hypothetical protein
VASDFLQLPQQRLMRRLCRRERRPVHSAQVQLD